MQYNVNKLFRIVRACHATSAMLQVHAASAMLQVHAASSMLQVHAASACEMHYIVKMHLYSPSLKLN